MGDIIIYAQTQLEVLEKLPIGLPIAAQALGKPQAPSLRRRRPDGWPDGKFSLQMARLPVASGKPLLADGRPVG